MRSQPKQQVVVDHELTDGIDKHLMNAAIQGCKTSDDPGATQVLNALENRVALHRHLLLRSKRFHFWLGMILTPLIPIGSAALTYFATEKNTPIAAYVGLIGLVLTVFTILNAVFRPNERYVSATHKLVDLHDWEMRFVIGLRKLRPDFNGLDDFLLDCDSELSKLGVDIADQLFPQQIGEPSPRRKTPIDVGTPPNNTVNPSGG